MTQIQTIPTPSSRTELAYVPEASFARSVPSPDAWRLYVLTMRRYLRGDRPFETARAHAAMDAENVAIHHDLAKSSFRTLEDWGD